MSNKDNVLVKNIKKLGRHPTRWYRTRIWSRQGPDVVFLWIPKTAGTSLFTWLEAEMKMIRLNRKLKYQKSFQNRGAVTFGHYDYVGLMEEGIVSADFDARAFKFCVVRDPWDRIASLYFYSLRNKVYDGEFIEFLSEIHRGIPPVGLYNVRGLSQSNPQVDWITDRDGRIIADELYRMENLAEAEADLRGRFNLGGEGIGHANKTSRDRSKHELFHTHDEIIPMVKEVYARDFEVLGYPVELEASSS